MGKRKERKTERKTEKANAESRKNLVARRCLTCTHLRVLSKSAAVRKAKSDREIKKANKGSTLIQLGSLGFAGGGAAQDVMRYEAERREVEALQSCQRCGSNQFRDEPVTKEIEESLRGTNTRVGVPLVESDSGDWHPDPNGLFEYRYWDGTGWTHHVSTGGVRSIDPVMPPPPAL